jgi:glycosyltransferase involved in cell wall biosynthesis
MTQRDEADADSARHVLVIVENLPLCVDHRLGKQVPALLAAGHHVTVVTRRDPGNEPWRTRPRLTLMEHPSPAEPAGPLGYGYEYATAFVCAAVLSLVAHHRRRVDVVQFCQPPDVYFPLAWLLRALGVAVLVDQRDLMPELFEARYGPSRPVGAVLRWLERRTQRAAHHTIGVNGWLQARLEGAGAARPVSVVSNGPALARISAARPDPSLRDGAAWRCCWIGKMNRQDRVDLLVEALGVLVHDRGRRDCRIAIVGDGECLADLRARVHELGLDAWVTLPGWVAEDALFTHLASADVGLDTSLQAEVSPVKAMEYMAFGLPVVAFDLPETAALVRDAGVLVPPGDTLRFAAELDDLLDDPDRVARLGRIGRRRFVDELSWERHSEVYLAAIETAIHAAHTGPVPERSRA